MTGSSPGTKATIHDRLWKASTHPAEPPVMRTPHVYLLGAAIVLVLGVNWPIMGRGVTLMPAEWLAAFRLGGATVLVTVFMAFRRRIRRPTRHDLPILFTVGVVQLAVVTTVVFAALRYVPPGRSAILVYASTLWTFPLAAIVLHERLTTSRVVGLALGCSGLVLLLEPWSADWSDGRTIAGFGLLLLGSILNAATTVHIRAHSWRGSALELMPWLLGIAALPITLLAFALHGPPHVRWTLSTAGIVVYEIALASAFAVWGSITLARSVPAISTSLILMAVPVVGLLSSIVLVGESATIAVAISLALVLGGVGLGLRTDRSTAVVASP
ncbi:MAG: DMT family transporter [Actinomycetota bacterium]